MVDPELELRSYDSKHSFYYIPLLLCIALALVSADLVALWGTYGGDRGEVKDQMQKKNDKFQSYRNKISREGTVTIV